MTTFHKIFCILSVLAVAQVALADYDPSIASDAFIATIISTGDGEFIMNWTCVRCADLPGYRPYFYENLQSDANEDFPITMLVNDNAKKFVTAFPGTATAQQLLNENFGLGAVDYTLHDIPEAQSTKYFYTRYTNILRNEILNNMSTAYAEFPDYEFIFTGHSLGAAITTLVAFDIVASGVVPSSQAAVYNFGSPRVANQALALAIGAAIPNFYRITHWQDPVPHIPLCVKKNGVCVPDGNAVNSLVGTWPAWHVATEIFYNDDGSSYKVCTENQGEDPNCSDQFKMKQTTWADHFVYMNIELPVTEATINTLDKLTKLRYPSF